MWQVECVTSQIKMKEYITIKDFGPLKNIENLEIKPFTFLIGESASGKSTLMKLVSMMRYAFKMANISSYLFESNIINGLDRIDLLPTLKKMGLRKMIKNSSEVVYRVVMDDGKEYSVEIFGKLLSSPPVASISPNHISFNKISFVSENRNILPSWSEHGAQNNRAEISYNFDEMLKDFVMASKGDKEIDLGYIGMKLQITHPSGRPVKYMVVPDDGRHAAIELHEASSGIQTSAPLTLIVKEFANEDGFSFKEAFKRSVFDYLIETEQLDKFSAVKDPSELSKKVYIHIEEPELSLYPDAQCKLVEEIIYSATHAANDRELNVMMATHSPYIMNYLNVVLNQNDENRARLSQDNTAVYCLYDGETQDLMVQNERGKWIVDTYDLSETMSDILRKYRELDV